MLADGQTGLADLADEIGLAGEQSDDVVFAKPELAEPILNLRPGTERFDAHRDAGFNAAQRANFAPDFFPPVRFGCLHPVHNLRDGVFPLLPEATTRLLTFCGHNLHYEEIHALTWVSLPAILPFPAQERPAKEIPFPRRKRLRSP